MGQTENLKSLDDIHILRNFLDKKNPRRDIIEAWEDDELKTYLAMAEL